MITYRQEAFREVKGEYGNFVYAYWHASPENRDLEPLDFNWDVYDCLDNDHMLHLTVGREDGSIAAAALYIVMMDIKRRSKKVGICDTFAVSLGHRGRGVGRQLYQAAERHLIEQGVHEIQNGYREVYNVEPLFTRLGFELEHRMYVKKVG